MTPRIQQTADAADYKELRPLRMPNQRAMVSHLFTDADYWWPYRSALCGREIEGSRLTDENLGMVEMCLQCRRRAGLPRKGRRDAA